MITISNPFSFFLNTYSKNNFIIINVDYVNKKSLKLNFETLDVSSVNLNERKKFQDFFTNIVNEKDVLRVIQNDHEILFKSFEITKNFEKVKSFLPFVSSTAFYYKDLIDFYSNNFSNSGLTPY